MEPYGFGGFRKLQGCPVLGPKTVYKPSSVPDDNGLKLDLQTLREVGKVPVLKWKAGSVFQVHREKYRIRNTGLSENAS
jgi:hypothetical protein